MCQTTCPKLKGKLTIYFLPPYSPELNPDELVWGCVKGRIGRCTVQDNDEMAS
ncbi:MAG: transposase [Pseudobacteriovorax sp.]|nr:transposase [Pseudobacteriovorax sp.]